MVGQTVLNVELISDAASYVTRGRELILAGELGQAIEQYKIALAINRDHAPAHLALGVALKLQERSRWRRAGPSSRRAP